MRELGYVIGQNVLVEAMDRPSLTFPPRGQLRRPDTQGGETRGPADPAADGLRARRQPEDRDGAWAHDPASVLARADKIIE